MYNDYIKTTWKDGNEYGADSFNHFEDGLKNLETYSKYREKQAENMGKALKKLRTNQNVKIGMRGDSVMYGYNTITGGEEGVRRYPNAVPADGNPSTKAQADGFDGTFYYGSHPLRKSTGVSGVKDSYEVTGNGANARTEVQIMDVMIQCLNEVYEGHISYSDKVFTGDSAVINYYRYDASMADICLCNLGINDALAGFLGSEYVGNVDEFSYWYRKLIEREIDNGAAFVIVTPVLQTTVSSYDTDARTVVDVYEKVLYDFGKLYGIPVINGNELSHNFNNKMIIDFTHFTCGGNETIGKKLAAPFISGCLTDYKTADHGDMIGVRPQEDYINVYGNACIDYTDKAPSFASMLDNNDLYDTGVNRINKGLGVFVNYPIDGQVKDLYDKSLLEKMELTQLNEILSTVWEADSSDTVENATTDILEFQNDYILNTVTEDVNVLWRQADLYARGSGVRGSAEYKKAYDTRMTFLQGKHGYANHNSGAVSWSFYCKKDGVIVIPSIYSEENADIVMELDFESIVPEKNGYYLTLKELDELKTIADDLSITYDTNVTKDDLIELIKTEKGYDLPGYKQNSPTDICDWTGSDTIDYDFVEPASCVIHNTGYYSKRKLEENKCIKITGKGWHTVTLYSNNNTKFLAFGVQFLDKEFVEFIS